MTNAERQMLQDAIETAIRSEREKLIYKKWAMFFGIISMGCLLEIATLLSRLVG